MANNPTKLIKLNDILKLDEDAIKNTKIRLMTVPSSDPDNDPVEKYKQNPKIVTDEWFLWKQKVQGNPFSAGNLGLGFLKMGKKSDTDKWLFVTAKKITKCTNPDKPGVAYEADVIDHFSQYFGRLVVKYHNEVQNLCRKALGLIDEMEVLEILPSFYEGDDFPGYDNVTISWKMLDRIIERQKKDWISALRYQKGIYLITDTKNGKHYVGKASGKDMLLQRWTDYKKDGHGGNVELAALVKDKGFDYIKNNFQYSILEVFRNSTDDDYILKRETWWKNALKSLSPHGYN